MFAAALAAITPLAVIGFGEYDVAFLTHVEIFGFQGRLFFAEQAHGMCFRLWGKVQSFAAISQTNRQTLQMLDSNSAQISSVALDAFGLKGRTLDLLREDLLHPIYGGNKWRKLRYNLEKAKQLGAPALLTFGGPWSNHLHAAAAACRDAGLKSIGVIRGELPAPLTDTLRDCEEYGMHLHPVSRAEYAEKHTDFFKAWLRDEFGQVYIVPEGGSNFLGVQGCMEILSSSHQSYKNICVAMGTGATAAGLVLASSAHQHVWGFPMVKGGDGLQEAVKNHVYWSVVDEELTEDVMDRFSTVPNVHRGGFAHWDEALLKFLRKWHVETGIRLDHVYTGKLVMRVLELMKAGGLQGVPLVVHTGGLQGLRGMEQRLGEPVFSP